MRPRDFNSRGGDMLQRYKLRLRDGTLLVVDHDALSTWLVDRSAMVQLVGSDHWLSLRQFLARERAAARSPSWHRSRPDARIPLIPPPPRDGEGGRGPIRPSLSPPISEPPSLDVPAEEAAVPPSDSTPPRSAPDEEIRIAVMPLADDYESPRRPDVSFQSDVREPLPFMSEPPSAWVREEPAAQARSQPLEPPPSLNRQNLQVLAEETATLSKLTPPKPTSSDGLPIIALKLRDDEDQPALRSAVQFHTADEDERAELATGLEGGFLGLPPPWGARVNRWLDHLSRALDRVGPWLDRFTTQPPSVRLPAAVRLLAEEPAVPRAVARHESDKADAMVTAASRARVLLSAFRGVASAWTDRLGGWVGHLKLRDHPSPPLSPDGPAASGAAGTALPGPPMPPPPINELPVLRFAKTDDLESEREDDDIYQEASSVDVAWLWGKRVTLIAGLLAGGIAAAATWEAWLPKAAQFSRIIFIEIDKRARPSLPSREEEPPPSRALEAAAKRLPQLAPDTIALVMSSSLAGVLDPPEVFGRAYDATERGMSALTPEEAQEMKALRSEVLATLRPAERELVHEYDLVRVQRVTLPFEDREVLGLLARGARALPPPARERLQALSGKAIAAGLSLPAGATPEVETAR